MASSTTASVAVELISGGGVVVGVGDERVVSPVGPHLLLGVLGESGAAHHEANGALVFAAAGDVLGLGDLGAAALGVGDVVVHLTSRDRF